MSNNIKVIKLSNGDDIVCKLVTGELQLPDKSPLMRLDRPLQIKYIPSITSLGFKDYVAMIKWASYTNDKIITIPKDKIMTMTNASSEIIKSYNEIKSDYDKKPKKLETTDKYQRERFSDEENKRLNEIFNDLDDDEGNGTLH
tara:strand:+ start:99 stop:527 length:429 start_codon:yes stop_codon:yes gene_type:complete